jgi:hypothetical protein
VLSLISSSTLIGHSGQAYGACSSQARNELELRGPALGDVPCTATRLCRNLGKNIPVENTMAAIQVQSAGQMAHEHALRKVIAASSFGAEPEHVRSAAVLFAGSSHLSIEEAFSNRLHGILLAR